jgi:hypothetical protein
MTFHDDGKEIYPVKLHGNEAARLNFKRKSRG